MESAAQQWSVVERKSTEDGWLHPCRHKVPLSADFARHPTEIVEPMDLCLIP